jgi:predicted kinase
MSDLHNWQQIRSNQERRAAGDGGNQWQSRSNEQRNGLNNEQTFSNGVHSSGRDEHYQNGGDFSSGHGRNTMRRDSHRHEERAPQGGGVDLKQYTRHDHRSTNTGWETVPSGHRQWQQSRGGDRQRPSHSVHARPPFMLILVGIPGSGKSTFAKSLESSAPHVFVRINQDSLGNRRRCEKVTRQTLAQGKVAIIDRCNFDSSQRRYFIDIAREYQVPVDCISLELPKEECVRRCEFRENHETIERGQERQVVNKMMSMFEAPIRHEGFRRVERISRQDHVNDVMEEYRGITR